MNKTATYLATLYNNLGLHFAQRCHFSVVKPHLVSPLRNIPSHIKAPTYVNNLSLYECEAKKEFYKRKSKGDIELMRTACKMAKTILDEVGKLVKPGATTDYLDSVVHELCIEHNIYPSPLLYRGFPKSVCTSVNNVVCHGIPDSRALENGDIINIDITIFQNGFHGDVSYTYPVGEVDHKAEYLIKVAKDCRDEAVAICKPGVPLSDIGKIIESIAANNNLEVIPNICGHGIGSYFHGPPDIIHVDNDYGGVMEEGMTFTIEPVLTDGGIEVSVLGDGWTVVTADDSRTAQFEHTILITKEGHEVLTA